jgi:alanyl-tRNA synthetase
VSKELAEQGIFQANTIIKTIGRYIKGGGGGQPFFATAGGNDPNGLSDALEAARKLL